MDRAQAQQWLDAYVHAWKTYDPQDIGALFAEDAVYHYDPFGAPVRGRDAILASWLEEDRRDPPGTYDAHYAPLVIEGQVVVTNGRSRYYEADGATLVREYDNLFVVRFDGDGRCAEFREWYMQRPPEQS